MCLWIFASFLHLFIWVSLIRFLLSFESWLDFPHFVSRSMRHLIFVLLFSFSFFRKTLLLRQELENLKKERMWQMKEIHSSLRYTWLVNFNCSFLFFSCLIYWECNQCVFRVMLIKNVVLWLPNDSSFTFPSFSSRLLSQTLILRGIICWLICISHEILVADFAYRPILVIKTYSSFTFSLSPFDQGVHDDKTRAKHPSLMMSLDA